MKCNLCSLPSVTRDVYLGEALCRKHFLGRVEKKIKKHMREEKILDRTQNLWSKSALCRRVLDSLIQNPRVRITSRPPKKGLLVVPSTMDEVNAEFLESIQEPKNKKGEKFALFGCLTTLELTQYAKIRGLPYSPPPPNPYGQLFTTLAKKYPEVTYGFREARERLP